MNRLVFGSSAWAPVVLSALRVVVGLLYLEHGTGKMWGWPHNPNIPVTTSFLTLAGVATVMEIIGSPLIILGLLTRPVAFLFSGEMAVAYFMLFAHRSLYPVVNGGEGLVLYCFTFFYLAFAGGGAWSLDAMLARSRGMAATPVPART